MDVVRFTDEYEAAAPLYGRSPADLRARDAAAPQPPRRWLAIREGDPVGAAAARLRPDGRMFLQFTGGDLAAIVPLTHAAASELRRRLHTTVDAAEVGRVAALGAAGFQVETTGERFRVRFDAALAALRRAWMPTGLAIRPADEVDADRLFTLDNTLRNLTIGTDGWRGDRDWFREELAGVPPFDPAGYLVGVDEANGEYAGMVRIWRNPDGPRLGFVGVLPQYRNTVLAAALLRQALTAAAGWGHDEFATETSPANRVLYPRMARIGAVSEGRFFQMVRRR